MSGWCHSQKAAAHVAVRPSVLMVTVITITFIIFDVVCIDSPVIVTKKVNILNKKFYI